MQISQYLTLGFFHKIIDKATFENPHQYSVGMKFVIVNGIIVVEEGKHNGNRPGKIIYGPGKGN